MYNKALVANKEAEPTYGSVQDVPIPQVPKDQILIKAVAYAANPADWKHFSWRDGSGSVILGRDVAGVVEEVGSEVKNFVKGDIVSNFQRGGYYEGLGAFAHYTLANPATTIKYNNQFKSEALPVGNAASSKIDTFEGAASVTLGLSTIGLSFSDSLKLQPFNDENSSKYILIWGGSSSTGFLGIQIAKLVYGLKVITTASKKHHDALKALGADAVFDYHDADVVDQIRKYAKGEIRYALDAISSKETFQATYDATADSKELTIDNLSVLDKESINTDNSRSNIVWSCTLSYLALGSDLTMGPDFCVKATPELLHNFHNFWDNLLPPVIPKIKHNNLEVLKPGLESGNEAITLLKENKVTGAKVVFRA